MSVSQGDNFSELDIFLITSLLQDSNIKGVTLQADTITQLHTAALGAVTLIRVAKNAHIEEPILLSTLASQTAGLLSSLLVIVIEQGARATFVEDLRYDFDGIVAPRIECVVGSNGYLNFISLQALPEATSYLARHRIHAGRDAKGEMVHVGIGGAVSRIDLDCKLNEPGGSFDLFSLFLTDKKRHNDFHATQEHLAPYCRSDLYTKDILKDSARSIYYGYIRVAEGSQKTDAYQTNRNLVLSAKARADSIPNLEIKANDVKCSHGSSVGQVSIEDMFYLQARGLAPAAAERLLVEGFIDDLISRIHAPLFQKRASEAVLNRLDQ